jgi:hypothetical protein
VFREACAIGLKARLVYQDPHGIGRDVLQEIGWFRIKVRKIRIKTRERAAILKRSDDLGRN